MNFKERYQQEMNRISPSPESAQQLQDALKAARKPQGSSLRRLQWGLSVAGAACAVLIAVGALWQPWNHPSLSSTESKSKSAQIAHNTTPLLQTGGEGYKNVVAVYERLAQEQEQQQRRETTQNILSYFNPFYWGAGRSNLSAKTATTESLTTAPTVSEDTAGGQTAKTITPDFSNTNIQVEGVQEADIIKTDGRYIYALGASGLRIIDPNNGHPRLVGSVADKSTAEPFFELYVSGDRLIGLQQSFNYQVSPQAGSDTGPLQQTAPDPRARPNAEVVTAVIFDVGDPADPRQLNSISQSGTYVSSRMIDSLLYLITMDRPFDQYPAGSNVDRLIPFTSTNDSPTLLSPDDISIYPATQSPDYAVVSALETSGAGEIISRRSVLGGGTEVYASLDSLYVIGADYLKQGSKTTNASLITRIALGSGHLNVKAAKRIPGSVNDQFSLDEADGVLRVVTTAETSQQSPGPLESNDTRKTTNLYCLDRDLQIIGRINDIAPDEKLYSCRYVGDYAYFVTFRQVDPLFSADLSDPTHPRLVGALKIPGFSEYLHPWSKNELFGLGNTVRATGYGDSVARSDLKIAMFDTSDPTNVKVAHELTIPGKNYSEASYDHHAILISPEKNLIAFPAENSYLIYRYDRSKGFTKVTEITDRSFDGSSSAKQRYLRGLFIGEYFYVATPDAIASYQMPGFITITSTWLDER